MSISNTYFLRYVFYTKKGNHAETCKIVTTIFSSQIRLGIYFSCRARCLFLILRGKSRITERWHRERRFQITKLSITMPENRNFTQHKLELKRIDILFISILITYFSFGYAFHTKRGATPKSGKIVTTIFSGLFR